MARKPEVLPPTTSLLCECDHVTYIAKQTLLLISVLVLSEREHFSRNVMVSVGVFRMGKTKVVFIDPEAKVNSSYYQRDFSYGFSVIIRVTVTVSTFPVTGKVTHAVIGMIEKPITTSSNDKSTDSQKVKSTNYDYS